MTREEAIEALTSKDVHNPSIMLEALDMAIKALKQEPCEDSINRHSAKKIIFDEFEGWPTDEEVARLKRLTKQFDELPSVKQEPEVGHWIPVTNGRGGHECSKCHNYAPSYQAGGEHLSRFCPECGAKMEDDNGR